MKPFRDLLKALPLVDAFKRILKAFKGLEAFPIK